MHNIYWFYKATANLLVYLAVKILLKKMPVLPIVVIILKLPTKVEKQK